MLPLIVSVRGIFMIRRLICILFLKYNTQLFIFVFFNEYVGVLIKIVLNLVYALLDLFEILNSWGCVLKIVLIV